MDMARGKEWSGGRGGKRRKGDIVREKGRE